MKPKMILKLAVDMGMTLALLFLMTYERIGQAVHEWLGIGMFLLFVLHHILNSAWIKNLSAGRYSPFRVIQSLTVLLVFAAMAGSMVSGVILSRHALSFLPIGGGRAFARNLHMVSAYWGMTFMSLHLGLHWGMILRMAAKKWKESLTEGKWGMRLAAVLIAAYGAYAFVKRWIGGYMILKNQFVFFDFEEKLIWLLLDYTAIMGLFVFMGYYLGEGLKRVKRD